MNFELPMAIAIQLDEPSPDDQLTLRVDTTAGSLSWTLAHRELMPLVLRLRYVRDTYRLSETGRGRPSRPDPAGSDILSGELEFAVDRTAAGDQAILVSVPPQHLRGEGAKFHFQTDIQSVRNLIRALHGAYKSGRRPS